MMKWNMYIVFLGLAGIMASCNNNVPKEHKTGENIIPVKISAIRKDTVSPVFYSSGFFTTNDETPLSFKNGGIVDRIYVHEGDTFQAGQLLATVKGIEVKAASKQAGLAYEKAKRDYRRAENLYRDSVVTLEQMQNAKTAFEVAKQQKNTADFNLRHSEIRAAKNGYVLKRYLNPGQLAAPGTPVLLISGATTDQWLFKTSLSDAQWASLQVGDSAKIMTDIVPTGPLEATVLRKSEGIDPETGGFSVQLSVDERKGIQLATGLFGKATLFPSRKLEAWRIPYSALLDGDADSGYVFITNDKEHAQKVKVHISRIAHNYVIIDDGLEQARYLIVSGSAYLKDQSAIRVEK